MDVTLSLEDKDLVHSMEVMASLSTTKAIASEFDRMLEIVGNTNSVTETVALVLLASANIGKTTFHSPQ